MYFRCAAVLASLAEPMPAHNEVGAAIAAAVPHRITAGSVSAGYDSQKPEPLSVKACNEPWPIR